MKYQHLIGCLLVVLLSGCANGPYYYGGTGYRAYNIGGLPVNGSMGVNLSKTGLMFNPNVMFRPIFRDWR
ncbi:hypothetical protein [Pseudomonas sp. LB3P58]